MPFYLKKRKSEVELPGHKAHQVLSSCCGVLHTEGTHLTTGLAQCVTASHPACRRLGAGGAPGPQPLMLRITRVPVSPCCFLLGLFDIFQLYNLVNKDTKKGIKILTILLLLNIKGYLVAEKDKTLGFNSFIGFSFRFNLLMNRSSKLS